MSEAKHSHWKPILITIAAGLVLTASSCFGLSLGVNGGLAGILIVAALGGLILFLLGVLALIIVGVLALISGLWEKKS